MTKLTKQQRQDRLERLAYETFTMFRSELTRTNAICTRKDPNHIEGADNRAGILFVFCQKPESNTPTIKFIENGNDEVKATDRFIDRTAGYNHNEQSGTLPIEIINKWYDDPEERYKGYAGWIISLFNPELLNQIKQERYRNERTEKPGTFAFVLFHGTWGEEKPFAVVAFENIEKLKARILECLPEEWDIEHFNLPNQSDTEYWSKYINYDKSGASVNWDNERGGMIQNCWHIPLKRLTDIATITMLGEENTEPSTDHWNPIQQSVQENRLQFLKDCAFDKFSDGTIRERRLTHKQAWDKLKTLKSLKAEDGKEHSRYNGYVFTENEIRELFGT